MSPAEITKLKIFFEQGKSFFTKGAAMLDKMLHENDEAGFVPASPKRGSKKPLTQFDVQDRLEKRNKRFSQK